MVANSSLNISPNQSATLRLDPGTHQYRATAGTFSTSGEKSFEPGVYDWVFTSSDFPRASVLVQNQTTGTLSLQVASYTYRIRAGLSSQLILSPGNYRYVASSQGISTS